MKLQKSQVAFFAFCFAIFLISFTKLSVPAIGKFELTISDVILIFLFLGTIFFSKRLKSEFKHYLLVFIFFLFTMMINIVVVKNFEAFYKGQLPYIFAFIIIVVTIGNMSSANLKANFKKVWIAIFFSLFFSAIPAYIQIITRQEIPILYDNYGWRYTFLAQNPNQFGVWVIVFSFLLTLITQKYFKNRLVYVLILQLLFFPAILFSASRTTLLAAILNLGILVMLFFTNLSTAKKIIIGPLIALSLLISIPFLFNVVKGHGGQVTRALAIFERLEESDTEVLSSKSPTGESINEGVVLFKRFPIFGTGMGNRRVYSDKFHEIHNTYLKIAANTGTVGLIGFLSIFFLPFLSFMTAKKTSLKLKFVMLMFYGLFMAMNYPHMLLRQRWVWFFMVMCFIISKVDEQGNVEKSYLKVLN